MARIWFVSAPLPGHLDWGGLLKTAQVLHARGHTVQWVSEPRIQRLVEAAGVPFVSIDQTGWRWPPPPLDTLATPTTPDQVHQRYQRALDTWLDPALVISGARALLAQARTEGVPDAIVSDPFLSAAALAAEGLGVPFVVGGWASGAPVDEDEMLAVQQQLGRLATERLAAICADLDLRGVNFSGGPAPSVASPLLHISYFNAYWHQGERVLPQTEFVGGAVTPPDSDPPEWLRDIPADQPLGLVTLGSTFTGDLAFFAYGARALAANGLLPLVVLGFQPLDPAQKAALKRHLPEGTRLLNWVPYEHVFPRLRAIVHHGGMGTTHAAVIHAVPQVITPHAADQRGQARRARQAKVGLEITVDEVRQGQLRPAVGAITTTPFVREAIDHLAREFARLGGPARAADLIEDVARGERGAPSTG